MSNYPAGVTDANFDELSGAVYEADPREVDVCVAVSISKGTTVETTDYTVNEWLDEEHDEDGYLVTTGGIEYDFSQCDLKEEYHKGHYDIIELLDILKDLVTQHLVDIKNLPEMTSSEKKEKRNLINKYELVLEDCQGWIVDDEEVVEE